ncbi:lipoprotein-releasing ABC transporter permease subunit [Psychrobacter lutiphocae]|uniref:lipoprotein-releasing ABC transporter permease subunit n=1 Tax=Psychrobacter lutiphocae TaxID=540500 RepID=UPI000477124B|nr:lipoprotein-releasing ABC transporter permease subunit [Psychrobacter lutiphocae]
MRRSLPTFIALRFMQSKKSNGFLSFITWISMFGLILGVAALVVVTSVLNGFEQALTTRILGMVPQVYVVSADGVDDWENYAQQIRSSDSNVAGVAPFINTRGMTLINGELHGTVINGIDYQQQAEVSILPEMMIEGSIDSLQPNQHNIVLGKTLVDERGLKLGDKISIMLVVPSSSAAGVQPKFYSFQLSGVFSVSKELDSWMSYINIEDATTILGTSHNVGGLRLSLHDIMDARGSAEKAKQVFDSAGTANTVITWNDTHQSLYDSIKTQKTMMFLLLFMIVVVAIFNVVSALVMLTTEKKSAIAILKTFGATKKTIVKIFMTQGIVIGAMGTVTGLIVGVGISLVVGSVSAWVNTTFNLGLFDNYFVSSLPSKIELLDLILIASVSMFSCILASVYPALKAANNHPVAALKHE